MTFAYHTRSNNRHAQYRTNIQQQYYFLVTQNPVENPSIDSEEEHTTTTILFSCLTFPTVNPSVDAALVLALLKKQIQQQHFFLVNFSTANPSVHADTALVLDLFTKNHLQRNDQAAINQSATSTLTMKLTTAAPTVLFSFIVASTMVMEPSLSEKILMREENEDEVSRRII